MNSASGHSARDVTSGKFVSLSTTILDVTLDKINSVQIRIFSLTGMLLVSERARRFIANGSFQFDVPTLLCGLCFLRRGSTTSLRSFGNYTG